MAVMATPISPATTAAAIDRAPSSIQDVIAVGTAMTIPISVNEARRARPPSRRVTTTTLRAGAWRSAPPEVPRLGTERPIGRGRGAPGRPPGARPGPSPLVYSGRPRPDRG